MGVGPWITPKAVEQALVEAFRALPNRGFYRAPSTGLRVAEHAADDGARSPHDMLNLAALALAKDPSALRYLFSWARCEARAQRGEDGASYANYCREMGWKRPSAEKGRRRGAAKIARALGGLPDAS